MFKSKYSTVLTILLAVLIVAIVIIVIVLVINTYKDMKNEKDAKASFEQYTSVDEPEPDDNEEENKVNETPLDLIDIAGETSNNSGNESTTSVNLPKVRFYKNYPSVGNINIPKTGASYPILLDTSSKALEIAVGVTYPSNPELNKPGNVVIIGHNYRNGKFFSNNKKLVVGDKIQIKDLEGKTLVYTIYEIFETIPTDTAYMTRKTEGRTEISLSTCTDDGNNRLVILARVEE